MAESERRGGGSATLSGLFRDYRAPMLRMAMVSLLGAMLEAGFLVLVTAIAMALVGGEPAVGPLLGQSTSLGVGLGLAAAALIVRLALNVLGVRISAALTARVTADQRTSLAHAYLGSSWAVQQGEPSGRLQELLTSFVTRVSTSVATLTNAMTYALSLIAFLVAALLVDPLSTLAVVAALALVGAILTPFRQLIRRRAQESAQSGLQFANAVSELGALGLEMQVFGVREQLTTRIDRLTRATTAAQRHVQALQGFLAPLYLTLAYAAVLVGIGIYSLVGGGDLAVVGAVLLLMLRSLAYGQQLATAVGSLVANAPFLRRIDDVKVAYLEGPAQRGSVVPKRATPMVFRDVTFGYTGERPALSNVTFTAAAGEAIGVIGPSGAGKSTLAQLLLGLREPDSGTVKVGGARLPDIDRNWWTERVTFVAQEPRLFTGTVAENIRFFREGIEDHEIRRAAERANILADIEALPHGFDTHLGERGSQLSGGQRQRLSIARALAGDPEILILDEPTSALDGKSEALIRQTLAELKGDVTVVLIAHRMSTLDICDRIMVIEHGRVTGLAAPAELRQTNAFYREALAIARGE